MADSTPDTDAMNKVIDAEALDENESRVTKQLYEALMENRESLSGGGQVPQTDQAFSEKLHQEASRRSAEITAYQGTSNAFKPIDGEPIPKWLIAAWIGALLIAAALVWWVVKPLAVKKPKHEGPQRH